MIKGTQPLRFLTLFPSLIFPALCCSFPCHFPSPWPQNMTQEPPLCTRRGWAGSEMPLERSSAREWDFHGSCQGDCLAWSIVCQARISLPSQGACKSQGKHREELSSAEEAAKFLQPSRALAGTGSSAGAGAEHSGEVGESQTLTGKQLGWSWDRHWGLGRAGNGPPAQELLWSLSSTSSSVFIC